MSEHEKEDLEFENLMNEKMQDIYGVSEDNSEKATDERLKEMNKKLPNWNLEPPRKFLK